MPEVSEKSGRHRVRVQLGERSYDVLAGPGLLAEAGALLSELRLGTRCAIVTDTTVGPLYEAPLAASLQAAGFQPVGIRVPAGEASKSMGVTEHVCSRMLQAGLDRKSFVIALGGGVIGDLAGFCAAIFNRGVPFIQIPTTIMSQVDSSVGGKTGVNTPEGKNLLGAFHQPRLVLADTDTLASLPDREYREGFAEVIKHAAIRDAAMVELIEKQAGSRENLAPLIARNVGIKAAVVEEDETETKDIRALLNFGHTVGHGIEAAAGYGTLLHGEAISLGMMAALRLSVLFGSLSQAEADRVVNLLELYELPRQLDSSYETARILELMSRDKKFVEGGIRFVLLRRLGEAFVSKSVPLEAIRDEIDRLIHG